jgi:hypothetical protein
MRLGSILDFGDRRSALVRWLIIGLLFLALMVVAARVAGAHTLSHDPSGAPVACAEPDGAPCSGHDHHGKGADCHGALGCHVMDVQPEFAVVTPPLQRSYSRLESGSLASQHIAPLFHPPKRSARD